MTRAGVRGGRAPELATGASQPSGAQPSDSGARSVRRGADGGQIIVLVASLSLGLLITSGFFIDMSLLFISRRHAQHLADAAALSAAGAEVNVAPLRNANVLTYNDLDITGRACAVLTAHPDITRCPELGSAVGAANITVVPGVSVTVEVYIRSPVTLMAIIGFADQTVRGKATAGLIVDAKDAVPYRPPPP